MVVIEALVFLMALVFAWFSTTAIRESIGQSPFLFLRLLTMAPDPIPFSFIDTVGLVTPIIAIALGFDAVNAEFNQRTLSRILAQPIYRDALLLGKFLARLLALAIALLSLWLLVLGVGLPAPRPAAERRGTGPDAGLSRRDDRLWGRVARRRVLVLDPVSSARHSGACRAWRCGSSSRFSGR